MNPVAGQRSISWIEKEARRDDMKKSERGGELAGLVAILLASLFFYAHQAWSTGFFAYSFGATEAFLLYGGILAGAAGPVARFVTGRRNKSRPPELLSSIFWIASSAWLLVVFPFNFTHFGDVLPDFLRILVAWITNDVARVLLAVGTLGGVVFTAVNAGLYVKVRALLESGNRAR